jgi:quercetin dioxygenase-like cupin family protein
MKTPSQSFSPPQDPDQIRELAHLYATEGLGEDDHAFHHWLEEASDEDQKIFADEVDAVSTLTLAMLTDDTPPLLDLDAIVNSPKEEKNERKQFPAGFFFQGSTEGEYRELPVKGARVKELSNSPADGFTVMMLEMDPGCRFPSHNHKGSEQVYLLDGDLYSDGVELSPGDFLRAAADSHHGGLYSEMGCHALIITAQQNYPTKTIHLYDRLAKSVRKVKQKILG